MLSEHVPGRTERKWSSWQVNGLLTVCSSMMDDMVRSVIQSGWHALRIPLQWVSAHRKTNGSADIAEFYSTKQICSLKLSFHFSSLLKVAITIHRLSRDNLSLMLLLVLHSIELLQTSTAFHAQINAGHERDDEEDDENYCSHHPSCVITATSRICRVPRTIVRRWCQLTIGRQSTGGVGEKKCHAYYDDPLETRL